MIVVDTNIIGYLYLSSVRSGQVEKVLLADPEWAAPLLWRSEFRNALALYIRKGILSLADALNIMEQSRILMLGNEYEVTSHQVLHLVELSTCSAYDCEFVALARDLGVPLITVDKQILGQFPNDTISLDAYAEKS